MAFGGETIDNLGVIRRFPSASMLTGLLAKRAGWRRIERERHQQLQDRLVFAARINREPAGGVRLTDFQSAAINNTERSWTTRGYPEGRGGGTYQNHLRYRDYFADMQVTVALRLAPDADAPTLGRSGKGVAGTGAAPVHRAPNPCLPSAPLFGGLEDGDTALEALLVLPLADSSAAPERVSLIWPESESISSTEAEGLRIDRNLMLTDQRNWVSRVARRRAYGVRGEHRTGQIRPLGGNPESTGRGRVIMTTTTASDTASDPKAATLQMVRGRGPTPGSFGAGWA